MARDALPLHSPASPPTAWCRVCSRPPPRRSEAFHSPLQGYCAWFLAWRGLWGLGQPHPPKRAFPIEVSADCHSQSTPFNSSHRVWMSSHILGNRRMDSHLWSVRWTVLSSPRWAGNWFHWHPERIRKMMALSVLRGSALLRPVCLGGSSSAINRSISSQRSSGTSHIVLSVS